MMKLVDTLLLEVVLKHLDSSLSNCIVFSKRDRISLIMKIKFIPNFHSIKSKNSHFLNNFYDFFNFRTYINSYIFFGRFNLNHH